MAYLHENREAFEDAVNHTRDVTGFMRKSLGISCRKMLLMKPRSRP